MILLLVDDEPAVREALEVFMDWASFGITKVLVAENGVEALEIIDNQEPDIMFCDMEMPKMNGIQLLEAMKERSLKTKVIAVSGYNEFTYVKSTIQAGGLDYILKPIDPEEVMEALDKAVMARQKEIDEEIARLKYRRAKQESELHTLRGWLSGKKRLSSEVEHLLKEVSLDCQEMTAILLVFQNTKHVSEMLFEGDDYLLRFSLENILGEIFGGNQYKLVDIDEHLQIFLVESSKVNAHGIMLEKFVDFCKQFYNLSVVYEEDKGNKGIEEIPYQVESLKQKLLARKVDWSDSKDGAHNGSSLLSMEMLLHSAISQRNIEGINRLLEDFCEELGRKEDLTYGEIQMQTIEGNFLLNRLAYQGSKEEISQVSLVSIWIFNRSIWQERVKHCIYKLMEYHQESKFQIEGVHRYLQEHYSKNITIDTLTEFFYQSPQHISKCFKERYHKTIVTALREIRMEHAKRYLETTNSPILEIAKNTGYEDENYFSKVFKKEMGISPKMYRKNRQK
jgi:two-component system response regulator YesN